MPQVKRQTASRTGVSQPGPAIERDGSRTKVSLPRRAADQVLSREAQSVSIRLRRQNSRDLLHQCTVNRRSRSSKRALQVTTGSSVGPNASVGTARLTLEAITLNATVELMPSTNITLPTIGVLRHWKMDSWEDHHDCDDTRSKHNVGDGWISIHWETSGWCQNDERHHDHDKTQRFSHAFFKVLNVDQLINSLTGVRREHDHFHRPRSRARRVTRRQHCCTERNHRSPPISKG